MHPFGHNLHDRLSTASTMSVDLVPQMREAHGGRVVGGGGEGRLGLSWEKG